MAAHNRQANSHQPVNSRSFSESGTKRVDGYELLLLRKFQSDPALFDRWKEKLLIKADDEAYDLGVSFILFYFNSTCFVCSVAFYYISDLFLSFIFRSTFYLAS